METYLVHHGIKGQKWGIRRYQNEDGTYTEAGRRRYGMNLDINDKSRKNVAKIRRGEALRRLDVAKENNPTNKTRIAELQQRVRGAKRAVKNAKLIDRGAALAAKGQTRLGNKSRMAAATIGAMAVSALLPAILNKGLSNLADQGRLNRGHYETAKVVNKYGQMALNVALSAYFVKKASDNKALRGYDNARLHGDSTIKNIGSEEYKDVVNRRKD